jgi:hypothetical protein
MLAPLLAAHRRPVAWRLFAAGAVPALAGTLVFATSKAKIESAWMAAPVRVDGINKEWDALSTIAKDVRFSMAARNDDRRLYIALVTSDRATAMQAVNEGLIVWVDPAGGSKKTFGLQYPLGRSFRGEGGPGHVPRQLRRPTGGENDQDQGQETRGRGDDGQDPDSMWKVILSNPRMREADVLGPGKDDRRHVLLDTGETLEAKVGWAEGMLVYELALPLDKTAQSPDGIGVRPGSVVGIGLETPERKSEGPGGERGGPGGMGGPGGGRGGGMGGMGGGGRHGGGMGGPGGGMRGERGAFGERPKAIRAWTTVQLATR